MMEWDATLDIFVVNNHDGAAYRGALIAMDPKIYKAAAKGNLEVLERESRDPLDGFLTFNQNTILHICISSILVEEEFRAAGGTDPASAAKFVKDVLGKCPSLLLKANAEDDTPLHVAARYGHASIVKVLIEQKKSQHPDLESGRVVEAIKEMIGKLNKERDTALHEAVRHNHIDVVKQLLIEVDPEFSFGANEAGETPLYLAAERGFPDLVSEILDKFKSPAYDGPLGRTALHAATFSNDEGMTKNILEKYGGDLCKQADQKGWTPLHMAAYMGHIETTKLLLQYGREVAYMKDAEGRTALHIAAHLNQEQVTEEIISMCPDCCEVVDNKGRNALHLAVMMTNWRPHVALMIQDNSSLRNLLNQKDNDGNTPLYYYCNSFRYHERVLNSPRVEKMVFNKENQYACQVLRQSYQTVHDQFKKMKNLFGDIEDYNLFHSGRLLEVGFGAINMKEPKLEDVKLKEREKKMKEEEKAAQAHLVVAVLITTVTFAAGITMPGGIAGGDDHSLSGMAVLRKSVAFKAFIITDTLSLMLSSSAVFIHLFIPLIPPSEDMFNDRTRFLKMAFRFLLSSMVPMILAFVTGTYAVLEHSNIAISTCIICLSFFPILVYIFMKLCCSAFELSFKQYAKMFLI
ncbi:protein ACCELERATED CELL DEATH 6-like [Juglans microcarpa x Juglans regia]|uniref:protein ACCELERATED CELL DEATH 6-like n=1 Tax=Juglans microcarpa x Juglans regia TaxID=2249226 RepID=UPI001B7F3B0B|nr:protein ACCELERATED CELL DEATH 6-like [Juglans microcarpa x Juglans regia]